MKCEKCEKETKKYYPMTGQRLCPKCYTESFINN